MVQGVLIEDGCLVDTNPATGEVIGRVKCTTQAQVSATIAAARAAQPAWAATALSERISLLKGACNLLASKQSELAELITREMGKVSSEAREEAAGIAKDDYLDLIAAANAPTQIENGVVVREPHGVVAVCSPWNFPADEALLLTLPALAAGNTVVLKPSEVTKLAVGAFVADARRPLPPPPYPTRSPHPTTTTLQGDSSHRSIRRRRARRRAPAQRVRPRARRRRGGRRAGRRPRRLCGDDGLVRRWQEDHGVVCGRAQASRARIGRQGSDDRLPRC